MFASDFNVLNGCAESDSCNGKMGDADNAIYSGVSGKYTKERKDSMFLLNASEGTFLP